MDNRIRVLNVPVDAVTMMEAIHTVQCFIHEKKPRMVVTTNAEMVMLAQEDKQLLMIISEADLVVPDGAGVVWAARFKGDFIPERVAGYDLVQNLLRCGTQNPLRVYLFGGAPGVADMAKKKIETDYKGITVVGTKNGFFDEKSEEDIVAEIRSAQPDILLVALGVPKQEKWLKKYLNRLNVPVSMGVGGTFDVMAGVVKRAPLWMQQANLEWLYRFLLQPQRFLRMLALPRFVLKVIASRNSS